MQKIISNINQYKPIAKQLAQSLKIGDCLLLQGELGAGKTTFAKILIQTLTNNPNLNVLSPTFTILQIYPPLTVLSSPETSPTPPIYHYDLYRIKNPDELHELGFTDALAQAITIIEWPERLQHWTPKQYQLLKINELPNQNRQITLTKSDNA